MKILVLNSGSSSIKFQIFSMENKQALCHGLIEQIGEERGHLKVAFADKELKKEIYIKDHSHGLALLQDFLKEQDILDDFNTLGGVGHRVVHGGEIFDKATLIDNYVISKIEEFSSLAPLHNPINLLGIKAIKEQYPSLKQVAVFDTAFHQTLPEKAYIYALPYEYYENHGVRRYGFHGTSHNYVAKKAAEILKKDINKTNLITIHLGNGASITAIKHGKSIDTSMGLTPLEGLVMGTRCGDIDPAIIFYLSDKLNLKTKEIDHILNKRSGLKGICKDNDMREIEKRVKNSDKSAKLAWEIFCYRIKKYIGAYTAVLGRVDVIVFTGGIGENSSSVREHICLDMQESFGIELDMIKNMTNETCISKKSSKVKIFVIPTNEELEIALQTYEIVREK